MSHEETKLSGPDLEQGVPAASLPEGGMLLGHAHGEAVLLARRGDELFALSATCTHYGGPLIEGSIVGDTLRCPWHHACFSLHSGEATGGPALRPLSCWHVERQGDLLVLGSRREAPRQVIPDGAPSSVVILGAGAAGAVAAEALRHEGYGGPITMIGAEEGGPVDRPNLSKDYLAGSAPEEWLPLRDEAFYREQRIELVLGVQASSIDVKQKRVHLADGRALEYGALLLAMGAEPNRPKIPGADLPHVRTLRSLADSRAIIARAVAGTPVVVLGASFIGLEAAAALRTRGLEVTVVAPDRVPLEKVLGDQLGSFVRALHEEHGVRFHLGATPSAIDAEGVTLSDGSRLPAGLVVVGVGVRPRVALAEQAGLSVDRGVLVDDHLRTSAPDIYAAGDIARYPTRDGKETLRVEHWVVAERQGKAAAKNLLGHRTRYVDVPFFWSQHYDVTISYVGHAERWDQIDLRGDLAKRDALVAFRQGAKIMAVATIGRDRDSLAAEAAFEQDDQAALEALLEAAR